MRSAFDDRRTATGQESDISYCPQQNKICSARDEITYYEASAREFDKRIREVCDDSYSTLEAKAKEFNGNYLANGFCLSFHPQTYLYFSELIKDAVQKSQYDFDAMFSKTYGNRYETHKNIFSDLFKALNNYHESGNSLHLEQEIKHFFNELFRRIFEEINVAHSFNATYMKCVSELMDKLKVFNDTPNKLTTEIKRSFIATRTFYQAIVTAKDVIRNATKVNITLVVRIIMQFLSLSDPPPI